jgi:protein-disulfide isomerase
MVFPKQWKNSNLIVIVLVVVLVGAAFFIGNLTAKVQFLEKGATAVPVTNTTPQAGQPAAPSVSLDTIKALFGKDLIKFGDANRKVLFVEVADPSCPYCHIAAGVHPEINAASAQFKMVSQGGTYVPPVPEMKKLVDAGKASFVYIYDPGHGNGEMGFKALLCANEKGKFWEAHDLLMSGKGYEIQNGTDAAGAASTGPVVKNDKTKSGDMATFLASAVDATFMKSCLDSGKYDARLGTDTQLAGSLGVNGTPAFFVNAQNFAGAYSFKDMQSAVDTALK